MAQVPPGHCRRTEHQLDGYSQSCQYTLMIIACSQKEALGLLLKMHTFVLPPMKEDYSMGAQHQRDTLSMTAMPGTSLSR